MIYIDGIDLGEQAMITALGVDAEGNKHCLGLVQGTTENATVCSDLLGDGLVIRRAFASC